MIWGHKLHSHTHSYIHNAFYRAFQHLGYPTYWFDDGDNVGSFDFSNSLFITEGQVDKNIPLRNDCNYILHYCDSEKYRKLFDTGRCIIMQVFTNQLTSYDPLGNEIPERTAHKENLIEVEKCIYYDLKNKTVYMPWGTDLLPHEIDAIKKEMPYFHSKKKVYWIGTIGTGPGGNIDEIEPFKRACKKNGVAFIHKNPWSKGISVEENIRLIKSSYIAPAIVGRWQNQVGYIPCRIFKNISYGQMGVTNSKTVYDLFDGKIVYNSDTYQLFFDAQRRLQTITLNELYELMDIVKTKHTYLNRIQTLLTFLDLVQSQ